MNPLLRMVCGDCLRSVEVSRDENGQVPKRCPVCDGYIDDGLADATTADSHVSLSFPNGSHQDDSKLWAETWLKGSFGTVSRFQIRELLGDGGFGHVYKAYDPRLDRDVALKVLKHSNPSERIMERFFREARAVARLKHSNIVPVLDAGFDDQRSWIAYQYIDGRPLSRHLDSLSIDVPGAVHIVIDLARALDHAHKTGIYHRDVKPANVILDEHGNAYLIDFGLSRRADLRSELTKDGAILGTPEYMPPEQACGNSRLADERSDIYSLGIILFELLCGRRPSELPSELKSARSESPFEAPPLRALNKSIPVALERICRRALASNPAKRYRTGDDLAQELETWLTRRQNFSILLHPAVNFAMGVVGTTLLVAGLHLMLSGSPTTPAGPATKPQVNGAVTPGERLDVRMPTSQHDVPYVGNNTTRMIHTAKCRHVKTITKPVELESIAEAVELGFNKDCADCSTIEIRRALKDQTGL